MIIFAIHPHVIITYTYAQHCKGDSCKLSFLFSLEYSSSDKSQQVVIIYMAESYRNFGINCRIHLNFLKRYMQVEFNFYCFDYNLS